MACIIFCPEDNSIKVFNYHHKIEERIESKYIKEVLIFKIYTNQERLSLKEHIKYTYYQFLNHCIKEKFDAKYADQLRELLEDYLRNEEEK